MLIYTLRKLFLLLFTFAALSFFAFLLIYLIPGDPVEIIAGSNQLTQAQYNAIYAAEQFDRPMIFQYFKFVGDFFSGDLGISNASGEPVFKQALFHLPATLELIFYALIVSMLIGIPVGTLAALKPRSATDYSIMTVCLTGYSIPAFWWGLLMIIMFSITLGWLPVSGRVGLLYDVEPITNVLLLDLFLSDIPFRENALREALAHLFMPTLVIATVPTTQVIRTTRAVMTSLMGKNFIQAAQARGLSRFVILRKHTLPNTLLPVSRELSSQLGILLTGAMIAETIFAWPGIGRWLVFSLQQLDYVALRGGLLVVATFIVCISTISDLLHTLADPVARENYNAAH